MSRVSGESRSATAASTGAAHLHRRVGLRRKAVEPRTARPTSSHGQRRHDRHDAALVCPRSRRHDASHHRRERTRAAAEVYFQGAHVTAWHPATSRDPVLWMSRASLFEPGRPIRGGVPIRFPWFGAHPADPSAPAHGFARVREWKLIEAQEDASGDVTLALELAGEALSPHWAHRFRARHRITIGTVLRLELDVHNDDAEAFTFEEALHSYFAVRDIHETTITGLEGTEYLDKVGGLTRRREGRDPVALQRRDGSRLPRHAGGLRHSRCRETETHFNRQGRVGRDRRLESVDCESPRDARFRG